MKKKNITQYSVSSKTTSFVPIERKIGGYSIINDHNGPEAKALLDYLNPSSNFTFSIQASGEDLQQTF